jgi:hypothetical protein
MLEAMTETELEPEPATEAEPEPEELDPYPALTKNGVIAGSINTACAALLNFWDGGGRGASEGVGVWSIVLGVGVLLFEEMNVFCDMELERNG